MLSDTQMKKRGHGSVALQVAALNSVDLRALKWYDNKGISLLTFFKAVEPSSKVKRWDSKKKHIDVTCWSAVCTYIKFMGGIDLLNLLMTLYRIPLRSKKWYHKLLWYFLDMMVEQAWLLCQHDAECSSISTKKQLPLFKFKLKVSATARKIFDKRTEERKTF